MKYKIINLVFVFSLFNLFNFNIACAFFVINNNSDEIRIDSTIIDQSTQDNNVLQLYDNFSYNDSKKIFIKKMDGFICADQIEINIPLNILAMGAIYPENSIDRLLLANLRIKNLILEYEELQKRAQLLLQDSNMAGIRKINDKATGNKEKKGMDNIESEKEKIDKKIFNINRLSRLVQNDTSSDEVIFFENYSNMKNKTISSSENFSFFAESSGPGKNNSGLVKTQIDIGMQTLTKKENTELPWIFNLFLKILNYALNNRVEIILYMIFIALIGYFISLQIKQ